MRHLKKLNGKISRCSSVVDIAVAIGAMFPKVTFYGYIAKVPLPV